MSPSHLASIAVTRDSCTFLFAASSISVPNIIVRSSRVVALVHNFIVLCQNGDQCRPRGEGNHPLNKQSLEHHSHIFFLTDSSVLLGLHHAFG